MSLLQFWSLVAATGGAAVSDQLPSEEDVPEPGKTFEAEEFVPVILIDGKNVPVATSRSHESPRAFESGPAKQHPACYTNPAHTIPVFFPNPGHGTQTPPSQRPEEYETTFSNGPGGYPTAPSYGPGGYPTTPSYGPGGYPTVPSYGPGGYPIVPSYGPGGYQMAYMTHYPRSFSQPPLYNVLMRYPPHSSPYFHNRPLERMA